MFYDPENYLGRAKAMIGITLLATWATFGLALYLPIGLVVTGNPISHGVGIALMVFAVYALLGEAFVALFRPLKLAGAVVHMLLAAAIVLWCSQGMGFTAEGIGGVLAASAVGTAIAVALVIVTGGIHWSKPNRQVRPTPDPADDRSFETTFDKQTRVRIEHNGKTVYDGVHLGHTVIMLRDNVPYSGNTTLYIEDEPFVEWAVAS
jgi:hypothetical protein